jgi:hypothetical protein
MDGARSDGGIRRQGTGVLVLLGLVLLLSGCMRARLKREYRKPWSRMTTVGEDALWTVESTARVVGGLAVAVVTFGLVDPLGGAEVQWGPFAESDDDDSYEAPRQERAAPPVPAMPVTHHRGSRGRAGSGGNRVTGTRNQR